MELEFTKTFQKHKNGLNRQEKKFADYEKIGANSRAIFRELDWLKSLLPREEGEITFSQEPPLHESGSVYASFIEKYQLEKEDRLLLILSLARSFKPDFFDPLMDKSGILRCRYPFLGGCIDNVNQVYIPTLKTAIGIIAGEDPEKYGIAYARLTTSILIRLQVVLLESVITDGDALVNQALLLAPEYSLHLLSGEEPRADFSTSFPARLLHTSFQWEHLVLPHHTRQRLQSVIDWMEYGQTLFEEQGEVKKIKNGFPVLFYGPPGTGKTMAASLIGKACQKDVYQIDLSMIVSKYIGETEKNLARLFDKAENKDWILFFDEADALFGKRTKVSDSHDKYANQEMSYLLQRMENFPGLTILATNFNENLDPALARRFQVKILFDMPTEKERKQLWTSALPDGYSLAETISLDKLSEKFKVTGANIANVIKMSCVQARKRGDRIIRARDLVENIKLELSKEGRDY